MSSSAEHASYVFLLGAGGGVHPLPHSLYVALIKDAGAAPEFAGRTMRVADWYVRIEAGEPVSVVNEAHGLITFNAEGSADSRATPAFHPHRDDERLVSQSAALPSPDERERMRYFIFGKGAGE